VAHDREQQARARYYELTAAGRQQLADERAQWDRLSRGVNLVLSPEEGA
jgi:DNA-binding PadR family transcriptional regulator